MSVILCIVVVLAARRTWIDAQCKQSCAAQGAPRHELFNLKNARWSPDCRCLDANGHLPRSHTCPAAPESSSL
ncbi:hypothetical protein [Ottowia testudinis]|uniref:Uncharacterized protein n=1 Tax=Ottowia testudinis TaxID=2816950 RepID=A0A975CIB5_9BURK|nr:hypothetical protein [Ottowia testudinis]QTD45472.1 hypothetical protein J1M35_00655 [Ottowia testudinis]